MSKTKARDHGDDEAFRTIGQHRSPHWPKVEKAFRKLHPQCVACVVTSVKHVQIHHRFPFHYCIALGRPDLELDMRNLITLCEWKAPSPNHHLLCGHLDDFQSSNLNVAEDAITFRGMSAVQIQADKRWIAKKAARLKPLDQMTAADKAAFKKLMNSTFPKL